MKKYRRSTFGASQHKRVKTRGEKTATLVRGRVFWVKVGLMAGVIMMGGLYFVQINLVSQEGFKMRDLERNIGEVTIENQRLSKETSQLRSLHRIQEATDDLGLVSSTDVVYLSGTSGTLAAADH